MEQLSSYKPLKLADRNLRQQQQLERHEVSLERLYQCTNNLMYLVVRRVPCA